MRTPQPQYVVHRSPTPNGKRYWYIIGRPGGRRVRAWFATETDARKEANRRNQEMRKGRSETASPALTIRSPGKPVVKITEEISDDELLEILNRPYVEVAKEVQRLRQENTKMRNQLKFLAEIADRNEQLESGDAFLW